MLMVKGTNNPNSSTFFTGKSIAILCGTHFFLTEVTFLWFKLCGW